MLKLSKLLLALRGASWCELRDGGHTCWISSLRETLSEKLPGFCAFPLRSGMIPSRTPSKPRSELLPRPQSEYSAIGLAPILSCCVTSFPLTGSCEGIKKPASQRPPVPTVLTLLRPPLLLPVIEPGGGLDRPGLQNEPFN